MTILKFLAQIRHTFFLLSVIEFLNQKLQDSLFVKEKENSKNDREVKMEKKNLEKIGEVIKYLTIGAFVVKIGIPLTKELWEEIKKLCRELLRSTSNFQNYYHYQAIPKNTPSPIQKQNIACSSTLKDSGVKTMSQKPEIKTKKAEESPDEIEKETERFLKLIEYIQHPSVILICGWRGEGKSAFGWKLNKN